MIVTITCPACWQPTAIELAGWEGDLDLVDDCQVCCRALHIQARLSPSARDDEDGEDARDVIFGEPDVEVTVELAD